MIISKSTQNRIKRQMAVKPELQVPFYQDGYEYITNTFYMVKVPKADGINAENVPVMAVAEKMNAPKENDQITRFDIKHMIDMLNIIKDNGGAYVDISMNGRSMACTGVENPRASAAIANGLLMAIINR